MTLIKHCNGAAAELTDEVLSLVLLPLAELLRNIKELNKTH